MYTIANIVVTTVKGRDIFTIGSTHHEMGSGVVLEVGLFTPHAIAALEELEFIVVHMYLEEKQIW